MSAQKAYPAPAPTYSPSLPRAEAPKPRRIRFVFGLLLALLLTFVSSGAILILSPSVLEAMSAIVMKPQPGAIPWNGSDRITVVAMGLTQRTTEPARTDTLLAMDIDPKNHRVSMLSIPRDLWVNIPGYGPGKLAIAYEIGGPKLAAYTVEHELGIPVDYTLALTFRGFTKIVDAMGGVTVNVPQELNDPTYPCLTGYDYCPIDIKPGQQHMNGATALEFVRERHAFVQQDLARVQDQQAFAGAFKHTAITLTTWPRYGAILDAFQKSVITNLPLNDLPAVGVQYALPFTHVTHSYINSEKGLVKPDWSQDGQSILVPTDASSIPNLVQSLFSDPRLAAENASVAVLNGTSTSGAASDVGATLGKLGFRTVSVGNANGPTTQSEVIINTAVSGPSDYTARRLQRILNATLSRQRLTGQQAQIVVVVGSDFPGQGH